MEEIQLVLQQTPFGWRVSSDPSRAIYLNGDAATVAKVHNRGEALWSSDVLDLVIYPLANGVEITLKIHPPCRLSPATQAEAA